MRVYCGLFSTKSSILIDDGITDDENVAYLHHPCLISNMEIGTLIPMGLDSRLRGNDMRVGLASMFKDSIS
jgi:hypothetical protein